MDRRRHNRKNLSIPIDYTFSILEFHEAKKIHGNGITTDMSDNGLGLVTDLLLEPGHVLIINNMLKTLFQKVAVVRWAMQSDNSFRIGLEFR